RRTSGPSAAMASTTYAIVLPAPYPHVLEARREVVLHGLLTRRALRGLDDVRVDVRRHRVSRGWLDGGGWFIVIGLQKPPRDVGASRTAGVREGGGQLTARRWEAVDTPKYLTSAGSQGD
ncbi:hypothetical protein CHU98_g9670, partial [Xylaria longipes]